MALIQQCDGCGRSEPVSDNVETSIKEATYRDGSGQVRQAELCGHCRKSIIDVFPSIDDLLDVPDFLKVGIDGSAIAEATRAEVVWDGIDRSGLTFPEPTQ